MEPVYYVLASAAAALSVLRFGVVPVVNASRRKLRERRELVATVHELAGVVSTLVADVKSLKEAA